MRNTHQPRRDEDRELPHDDLAERSVLGLILTDNQTPNTALKKASSKLVPEDFFDSRHRMIFRCAMEIAIEDQSRPTDLVTVTDHLRRNNLLEQAGGFAYISSVGDGIPLYYPNLENHAQIVKHNSLRRQLIHTSQIIKESAFAGSEPFVDIVDRARLKLDCIRRHDGKRGIKAITAEEVMRVIVPKKEHLIDGLFELNTINEIFAGKGIGKTWFSLSAADAIANAGQFLKWKASRRRKVGYLDGELDQTTRKERFALLGISGKNLQILSTDTLDIPFPNIATPEGQRMTEDAFDPGIEVLFIDNLAALAPSSHERETEEWVAIQTWFHDLKRRGISTIFNHHTGHAGWARGTTKREDLCSTVIKLQHPKNYSPAERCRFELHFDKNRSGVDASPIECMLTIDLDGRGVWTWRDIDDIRLKQVKNLRADGLSIRDIVEETGIPRSTVQRLLKKQGA